MKSFEELYKQLHNDPDYMKELENLSKLIYPKKCIKSGRDTHGGATCAPCKRKCKYAGGKQ